MIFSKQPLICMICGRRYETDFNCNGGYGRNPGICSKECFDELGLRQARAIMGKPAPTDEHPPCWDDCGARGLNGGPTCNEQCGEPYTTWMNGRESENLALKDKAPKDGDCPNCIKERQARLAAEAKVAELQAEIDRRDDDDFNHMVERDLAE